MGNVNDLFPELFNKKDISYGKINIYKPLIVFIDGVGITKNHKAFPLMERDGYIQFLFECAKNMATLINTDCIIYTAMDETSFIFKDICSFINFFKMGNTKNYIQALFIQYFNQFFWKKYPMVFHKLTMFNIEDSEIRKWIDYRKKICCTNAAVYMAKEYLDKKEYDKKTNRDIIKSLKSHNLFESLVTNKDFYNGLLYHYIPKNTIDICSRWIQEI